MTWACCGTAAWASCSPGCGRRRRSGHFRRSFHAFGASWRLAGRGQRGGLWRNLAKRVPAPAGRTSDGLAVIRLSTITIRHGRRFTPSRAPPTATSGIKGGIAPSREPCPHTTCATGGRPPARLRKGQRRLRSRARPGIVADALATSAGPPCATGPVPGSAPTRPTTAARPDWLPHIRADGLVQRDPLGMTRTVPAGPSPRPIDRARPGPRSGTPGLCWTAEPPAGGVSRGVRGPRVDFTAFTGHTQNRQVPCAG
jgi:hypothetical protein